MSIKTKKEIVADTIRTFKIVMITTVTVLICAWLALGTYAIVQNHNLKETVNYYRQKEEKTNSKKTIEVNGQKYILVEDNA